MFLQKTQFDGSLDDNILLLFMAAFRAISNKIYPASLYPWAVSFNRPIFFYLLPVELSFHFMGACLFALRASGGGELKKAFT